MSLQQIISKLVITSDLLPEILAPSLKATVLCYFYVNLVDQDQQARH